MTGASLIEPWENGMVSKIGGYPVSWAIVAFHHINVSVRFGMMKTQHQLWMI